MDLPILFIYGLNKVMKNYRLRLMVLLLLFTLKGATVHSVIICQSQDQIKMTSILLFLIKFCLNKIWRCTRQQVLLLASTWTPRRSQKSRPITVVTSGPRTPQLVSMPWSWTTGKWTKFLLHLKIHFIM